MERKFRATEISGFVNVDSRQHGQYKKGNWFCINCNGIKRCYPECKKREVYVIPATAEVPKKSASKRIWDIFKKQFVFAKPVGYWFCAGHDWHWVNIESKTIKYRRDK